MIYKLLVQILLVSNAMAGGTLFAFSAFMMTALSQGEPEQGAKAMNSINLVIVRSPFIAFFLVSALLSLALPAYAWYSQGLQKATPLLIAGACYFIGVFLITMLFNVPLNDRLAALTGKDLANFWPQYVKGWTAWNHLRVVASIASIFALANYLRNA